MNAQPSVATLIAVIREELSTTVAPTVADSAATASLALIDEILRVVSIRSEHELAWMVEETDAAAAAAAGLVASDLDTDGALAGGLVALREAEASMHTTDIASAYSTASALLSRCVDIALPIGGDAWAAVRQCLDTRLMHEAAIRGEGFTLVARG